MRYTSSSLAGSDLADRPSRSEGNSIPEEDQNGGVEVGESAPERPSWLTKAAQRPVTTLLFGVYRLFGRTIGRIIRGSWWFFLPAIPATYLIQPFAAGLTAEIGPIVPALSFLLGAVLGSLALLYSMRGGSEAWLSGPSLLNIAIFGAFGIANPLGPIAAISGAFAVGLGFSALLLVLFYALKNARSGSAPAAKAMDTEGSQTPG